MDLKDIRLTRAHLCENIHELVREFYLDTGICVSEVRMNNTVFKASNGIDEMICYGAVEVRLAEI